MYRLLRAVWHSTEFIPGDDPQALPEDISLCLYRVGRKACGTLASTAERPMFRVVLNL